jgi:hypothetical protein
MVPAPAPAAKKPNATTIPIHSLAPHNINIEPRLSVGTRIVS